MKSAIVFAALVTASVGALARSGGHSSGGHIAGGDHAVRAHVTKKGVYVKESHATNPNGTKSDNYSHKGNVNPYTGKEGSKQ